MALGLPPRGPANSLFGARVDSSIASSRRKLLFAAARCCAFATEKRLAADAGRHYLQMHSLAKGSVCVVQHFEPQQNHALYPLVKYCCSSDFGYRFLEMLSCF